MAFLALVMAGFGCESPPATLSNRHFPEEEVQQQTVFSGGEQQAVIAALRELSIGHQPVAPPTAAPAGIRWSDVPRAAAAAARDVEMAIVRTEKDARGGGGRRYVFHIWTVDDRRAELTVMRTDDDRVYEASAWCGVAVVDKARAQRLLEAFDNAMREFGRKRAFSD